jgi:hypothetical protein
MPKLAQQITVPANLRRFEAPKWYGGAPVFLKFVSNISATDDTGHKLHAKTKDNIVDVEATKAATHTLHYTYNVPQSISGQVDFALPVLNENYARFDNNLTFLEPKSAGDLPAKLSIVAPSGWEFETGWGSSPGISIPKLSDLIAGMIVMGHYDYSHATVGNSQVASPAFSWCLSTCFEKLKILWFLNFKDFFSGAHVGSYQLVGSFI